MDNANSSKTVPSKSQPHCHRHYLWFFVALILLVVPNVFYHFQRTHHISPLTSQIEQMGIKANAQDEKIASLSDEIVSLKKTIEMLEKNKTPDAPLPLPAQSEDVSLEKARYLLELSQITLLFSQNRDEAIALLNEADKALSPISNIHFTPVREAIAKEITRLKSLPVINKSALLAELDALKIKIRAFELTSQHETFTFPRDNPSTSFEKNLQKLGNLIVVQRYNTVFRPWNALFRESILKEELIMTLSEMEWALMQNDAAFYELSRQNAIKFIEQFDVKNSDVADVLNRLNVFPETLPILSSKNASFEPLELLLPLLKHPTPEEPPLVKVNEENPS